MCEWGNRPPDVPILVGLVCDGCIKGNARFRSCLLLQSIALHSLCTISTAIMECTLVTPRTDATHRSIIDYVVVYDMHADKVSCIVAMKLKDTMAHMWYLSKCVVS